MAYEKDFRFLFCERQRKIGQTCFLTGENNNNYYKHAYAGQLNSFTHLRALLVLHDRGIFGPGNYNT
jgi:hypothetical protein